MFFKIQFWRFSLYWILDCLDLDPDHYCYCLDPDRYQSSVWIRIRSEFFQTLDSYQNDTNLPQCWSRKYKFGENNFKIWCCTVHRYLCVLIELKFYQWSNSILSPFSYVYRKGCVTTTCTVALSAFWGLGFFFTSKCICWLPVVQDTRELAGRLNSLLPVRH